MLKLLLKLVPVEDLLRQVLARIHERKIRHQIKGDVIGG